MGIVMVQIRLERNLLQTLKVKACLQISREAYNIYQGS
ncbi:hypothetical protein Ccrd_018305 [Cynara cardunculus var. scolymus]|uniref:Uncharacterized protein n=1 Tax=Cynara cardunculus var. scolymus TaxID=59895 RepID=A0A103Y6F7_CYNCS|nr:hypothetical protein Ccrd_018305 [Cynara cardunculus var. scolymus]